MADLSPMTPDLGVYARDIQQSIGVNIRNYMKPDRTHSRESTNIESPIPVVPSRRDSYRFLLHSGFILCFVHTIALSSLFSTHHVNASFDFLSSNVNGFHLP